MNVTNPSIWGPPLWDMLHYITFTYSPQNAKKVHRIFTHHLLNLMPCKHCRDHYKQYIAANPIRLDSRESLSKWLMNIHNLTNKQLGKRKYDYSRVVNRYNSPYTKKRVKDSFLKWTSVMRPNVLTGTSTIQRSYSAFLSYIFNYV